MRTAGGPTRPGHSSSRPGRQVDRQPARLPAPTTKCSGISAPSVSTSRSLAGLASTASTTPIGEPGPVDHLGADQLVHPQGVGSSSGAARQNGAPQGLGLPPGSRPPNDTSQRCRPPTSRCGRGLQHLELARRGACNLAPGGHPLRPVGPQLDHDLTAQPVGPHHPAHLEQTAGAVSPTPSVDDVDNDVDAVLGAGGAHHAADRLGHPAPAADHLAHVVGGHVQRQLDPVTGLAGVDR